MDKIRKIGYWETFNREGSLIEKSNSRKDQSIALYIGLVIALLSVIPYFGITLGESLPMVITLIAYSLGGSAWNKTLELTTKKGGNNDT
jgi:hypothetical protein